MCWVDMVAPSWELSKGFGSREPEPRKLLLSVAVGKRGASNERSDCSASKVKSGNAAVDSVPGDVKSTPEESPGDMFCSGKRDVEKSRLDWKACCWLWAAEAESPKGCEVVKRLEWS